MLEAASAGAKVLHNRSVNMGKTHSIPIFVKNSFNKTRGSIVTDEKDEKNKNNTQNSAKIKIEKENFENHKIKFITKKDDISKISIIGNMIMSNKFAINTIFEIAKKENINIYMITFSELSINIIVDSNVSTDFMKKLHYSLIECDKN